MKDPLRYAGILASIFFAMAVGGFGAVLDGYSQASHPVALLGAEGVPRAWMFNGFGFALPGFLAAYQAWSLRARLSRQAPWTVRIGAQLMLIAALAFAAQGLLPLDPNDLDAPASRLHAMAWTLWWIAFVAGAALFVIAARARAAPRSMAIGGALAAILVLMLSISPSSSPWHGLSPAIAQRLAFGTWLGWVALMPYLDRPSMEAVDRAGRIKN